MKKFLLDLEVKSKTWLNSAYVLLVLTSPDKLPPILPGQFVEVRVDGSPATFLRRPISVHQVDYTRNELWLLVQVVGDGSRHLAGLEAGDMLNVILPLGNGFSLPPDKDARLLLVGGGCGVAPLLYLGRLARRAGLRDAAPRDARTGDRPDLRLRPHPHDESGGTPGARGRHRLRSVAGEHHGMRPRGLPVLRDRHRGGTCVRVHRRTGI